MGATIGTLTNVLTNHWNWWILGVLTALVAIATLFAVVLDGRPEHSSHRQEEPPEPESSDTRPPRTRINNLPRDVDDFTGRKGEVSHLLREVERAAGRARGSMAVYSVEGMGGIGKTSLVLHVAHQIAENYPDAALYINLRAHTNGQEPLSSYQALALLLADLGVPGEGIPESLSGRASLWRQKLADAHALVILDNASGSDQIRELLAGGPGCLILVTSRRRLLELEGVTSISLSTLSPDDAIALFKKVLGAERRSNQHALDEVVARCGYLPLAVRLAAARLRAHPTWTVSDLLAHDLGRETSLERIYTLSCRDLPQKQRDFLRLVSAHPGNDITPATAAVLAGISRTEALIILDELYNRHLIEEPSYHRFQFHDLIKDFTNREGPEMRDDTERPAALSRLLEHYAYMATMADERIGSHDHFMVPAPGGGPVEDPPGTEAAALAWFDAELGNLLACAHYAAERGDMPYAWQLPAAMTSFLRLRGFLGQAVSLLDAAAQTFGKRPDLEGEAVICRRRGHVARLQGDYQTSRVKLDRSLQFAKRLRDGQGIAWCQHELGHLYRLIGDLPASRENLNEAMESHEMRGDKAGEAAAATNLGMTLRAQGNRDAARGRFAQALGIVTELEDRRGEAFVRYQLGALECETGHYEEARKLLTSALAIYDSVRNRHGQADCHLNIAVVDRLVGDYEAAKRHLTEALHIYVELGYHRGEADTYAEFAATTDAAGDSAMSLVHRHRADAIYEQLGVGTT